MADERKMMADANPNSQGFTIASPEPSGGERPPDPRPQAWYTREDNWGVRCKDHGLIATGLGKMDALLLADVHAWEFHQVRQPVPDHEHRMVNAEAITWVGPGSTAEPRVVALRCAEPGCDETSTATVSLL